MYRKLVITALLLVLPAAVLMAADVKLGVGGHAWYVKWDPYWAKDTHYPKSLAGILRLGNFVIDYSETSRIKPAPLYGPALNLTINRRIRLWTSFLYGAFNGTGTHRTVIPEISTRRINIKRYDSDSMISYHFNPFVYLFLGFKYSRFDYAMKNAMAQIFSLSPFITNHYTFFETTGKRHDEYAPGLGVGFIIPLIKKIWYLLPSISAIYTFTDYRAHSRSSLTELSLVAGIGSYTTCIPSGFSQSGSINRLGMNGSLSFAVVIPKIRTTLTLGFRYQGYRLLNIDTSERMRRRENRWDNFYGATASVMVNIDLTSGKGKSKEDDQAL